MLYETLFFTGTLGFLALVLLGTFHGSKGLGRHGSHGGHHGGHHSGHHNSHGHRGFGSSFGKFAKMKLLLSISPIDIFAFSLGTGATGLLLPHSLSTNVILMLAIVVGLIFDLAFLKPIFNFALQFVSKPSDGLEGTVAKTATAISKFDASGQGLVMVVIDGEEKQVLARLENDEVGSHVAKGDQLLVTNIDPRKNICQVSKV